ncbi:unnamed protein product [Heligmosomoides polygyrus]|uniref:NR LBD domain-containing protein n=1 Tax=Heligmosomoides polygyrus TaxID=6339 RepID=A0A183GDB4_HELPZ|nr:unnamed protein product [Heligmosomoides polygyrus]
MTLAISLLNSDARFHDVDDTCSELGRPLLDIGDRPLTRLNPTCKSTYDMMSRFLELGKPLELFLLERPRYPMLDATDWDTVKKIVFVLKPLAVATETVQHRYYSTISVVFLF